MHVGMTIKSKSGLSVAEQREVLAEIGCRKIFDAGAPLKRVKPKQDRWPGRTEIIEILRAGDLLCVVSAVPLARDLDELFTVVAALTSKQCALYVVEMAKEFTATEDQAALARNYSAKKRKAQTADALASPRRKKNPGGRPRALDLSKAQWIEFDDDWRGDELSIAQMGRKWGAHDSTIIRTADRRKLGPKG